MLMMNQSADAAAFHDNRIATAFLFALNMRMRQGEIFSLP